jgi:hypothetical protein
MILSLFLFCCLTAVTTNAQQLRCSNSIFINGDLENGTPTTAHQDIDNAVGFSRIWANNSWADYYTATTGPYTPPTPQTGNYASCWIANHHNGGTTYREGFQAEIAFTLPKNSGTYNLTFDAACLGGWGNSEIAVYALYNPSGGDAPNAPTGAFTPSNLALFGAANTELIGTIPVSATNCSNAKTNHLLTINTNSPNFPANGMTHIFVTHSDNTTLHGALYMGFDNFCIPTSNFCPASWVVNGDVELGTPTSSHQDIHLATGFDRIWSSPNFSGADYYAANNAPPGYTPPSPASGDYVSCWIANWVGGGTTYREGFQATLAAAIAPNTGHYDLSFDMACLSSVRHAEVAVYGITNPSNGYGLNPTSAYLPSNMDLFGTSNTVLLGTIPVHASTCNNNKTTQTITFNSAATDFPAGGITHFFVTHSDNNSIDGRHYMAFDDFCLRSAQTTPCPEVTGASASCNDGGGYTVTINTTTASGSMVLSSSCGTFSPSLVNLTGATSYNVGFTPNGSCGNGITINYAIGDADGVDCGQGAIDVLLPTCSKSCVCEEDFYNNVEKGFTYKPDCPNDFVFPLNLSDDCDQVTWTFDGVVLGTSTGNNTFAFSHLEQPGDLCMHVTRVDDNGEVCEHSFCISIEPEFFCEPDDDVDATFGPSARLNITPNPANSVVTVAWKDPRMPRTVTLRVFNSNGVAVKVISNINAHDGTTSFPVYDLPTGLYYLQLQGEAYAPAPIKFVK